MPAHEIAQNIEEVRLTAMIVPTIRMSDRTRVFRLPEYLRSSLCRVVLAVVLTTATTSFAESETLHFTAKQLALRVARQRGLTVHYLKRARAYLSDDPKRELSLLPQSWTLRSRASHMTLQSKQGVPSRVRLLAPRHIVFDLGAVLINGRSGANLDKLYPQLLRMLPFAAPDEAPAYPEFLKRTLMDKQAILDQLVQQISATSPEWISKGSGITPATQKGVQLPDCTNERGYEEAGEYSESSNRCAVGDYLQSGLMSRYDFPLKPYLTCVRGQGARGTCAVQTIVAAMETRVLLDSGRAENLSEQQTYFRAKVYADWESRYDDGLSLSPALSDLDSANYIIRYEQVWNYNRSWARSDEPSARTHKYSNSCDRYTGEMCTEYAFQAEETVRGHGDARTWSYTAPELTGGGHELKEYGYLPFFGPSIDMTLDLAILFVRNKIPVMACFAATDALKSADGYVNYRSDAVVDGGHCELLIGFISNSELAADLPRATSKGYFIAKNSWGIDANDCGFAYVSYDYLKNHGYYMGWITNVS